LNGFTQLLLAVAVEAVVVVIMALHNLQLAQVEAVLEEVLLVGQKQQQLVLLAQVAQVAQFNQVTLQDLMVLLAVTHNMDI
jgi:hypothetical protein